MNKFILLIIFLYSLSLNASKIAFLNDYSINIASVKQLKKSLSSVHTLQEAATPEAFDSLFSSENQIDIAILSIQDSKIVSDQLPNFISYVRGGGKVIFSDAQRDSSWQSLFDFAYTGNTNAAQLLFTNAPFASLVNASTQTLQNPGYYVFSMGLKYAHGTVLALFPNGDAASLFLNNQIIINGFLIDTVSTSASRTFTRSSSSSIILSEIAVLLNPSLINRSTESSSSSSSLVSSVSDNHDSTVSLPIAHGYYLFFALSLLIISLRSLISRH